MRGYGHPPQLAQVNAQTNAQANRSSVLGSAMAETKPGHLGAIRAAFLKQVLRPGLRTAAEPPTRWLWHGYLAAGKLTLLTSQWKSGKTTLLAVLLARLAEGGNLAGLA